MKVAAAADTERAPLVSIVTVVFNGEKHLERTILSVLGQSYPNIEYIIIDGGSEDGTLSIIERYSSRLAFWISEADNGIYDAMNKGIDHCQGRFVGLINADDYYSPDAVRLVVDKFQATDADLVFGNQRVVDDQIGLEKTVSVRVPQRPRDVQLNHVHPTVFVGSWVYDRLRFDPGYKWAADYKFLVTLFVSGAKLVKIDRTLATMTFGGASATLNLENLRVAREVLDFYDFMMTTLRRLAFYYPRLLLLKLAARMGLAGALRRATGWRPVSRLKA